MASLAQDKDELLTSQVKSILQWLRPQSSSTSPPHWEEGTCEWIFQHPAYQEWENKQYYGAIWVHGIPGCGKSVMANFLSHNPLPKLVFTHFFRASTSQSSTRAISLAASILAQLFRDPTIASSPHLDSLVNYTLPLLDHFSSYEDCPFLKLWSVIEALLPFMPKFTFVVDALDECTAEDDTSALWSRLRVVSELPNSRVIVLSRYRPEFQHYLGNATHLRMDPETVTADIQLFVKNEIHRKSRLQSLEKEILVKTVQNANGMFLWARMMLDYLQTAATPHVQRIRLQKFPKGLTAIYDKILAENAAAMEPEEILLRKKIFGILVTASRPLTPNEISVILALQGPNMHPAEENLLLEPEQEIHRMCWPLAAIYNGQVQIVHHSIKEYFMRVEGQALSGSVQLNYGVCQEYLARKCLYRLIHHELASVDVLGPLLQRTLVAISINDHKPCQLPKGWTLISYATENWWHHLTQATPTTALLDLVAQFFHSQELVTWSEMFLQQKEDLGPILKVKASLNSWHSSLPTEKRKRVPVDDFFDHSYIAFHAKTLAEGHDRVLPYIALRRLGVYCNLMGTSAFGHQPYELRKNIAEGFREVLGDEHPVSLRCVTDFCIERLQRGEFAEAEEALLKNAERQKRLFGDHSSDSYYSLQYAALSMYHQMKFHESSEAHQKSAEGLLRILGPVNREYLKGQMFHGYALEALGQIERAAERYKEIWNVWTRLQGPENPLSLYSECCMAMAYRKLGKLEVAEKYMIECLAYRQRIFGEKNWVNVDSLIHIAALYRDMGRPEQAFAYLDLVSSVGAKDFGFQRFCQVEHLRALLYLDAHDSHRSRRILEDTLHEASVDRHPNNRELLWIRLTLASILRSHEDPDGASALFLDLTKPIGHSDEIVNEPEPPAQLRVAEQALQLLRLSDLKSANDRLNANGLVWRHPKMYWIMSGAPAADTECIGPTRFVISKAS